MIDSVHEDNTICPDPALCHRLRRHVAGRDWEIWTGNYSHGFVDPALRERIIDQWEQAAKRLPTLEEQREAARKHAANHVPKRLRKKPKPPSFLRKAWTFSKAMFGHLAHGLPTASPRDQAKRWAVREPCEYRNKEKNVCIQCGCRLAPGQMFAKIKLADQQCPLFGNRPGPWWGKVKGEKAWARAWRWIKAFFPISPSVG